MHTRSQSIRDRCLAIHPESSFFLPIATLSSVLVMSPLRLTRWVGFSNCGQASATSLLSKHLLGELKLNLNLLYWELCGGCAAEMTSCSAWSLERRKEFNLSVFVAKYLSEALGTSFSQLCSPRQNTHRFARMSRQVFHFVCLVYLDLSEKFSSSWWFVHKPQFLASRLLSVLPCHSTQ